MNYVTISSTTELIRFATNDIIYVRGDGNYSTLVLKAGKTRTILCQLHDFETIIKQFRRNPFCRVGRSHIVNKNHIYVINLRNRTITFDDLPMTSEINPISISRDPLKELKEMMEKELKETMEEEKGDGNG